MVSYTEIRTHIFIDDPEKIERRITVHIKPPRKKVYSDPFSPLTVIVERIDPEYKITPGDKEELNRIIKNDLIQKEIYCL